MGQLTEKTGEEGEGQPETTSQRCQNPGWAEKGRQGLGWRWKEGRRARQVYGISICKGLDEFSGEGCIQARVGFETRVRHLTGLITFVQAFISAWITLHKLLYVCTY